MTSPGRPRSTYMRTALQRRLADRDDPLLRALAARAQHSLLDVHVHQLEPDGLRGAQPAGVHQLEQRTVAHGGRLGPARLGEQLLDLAAGQHLRQLARAARRAERGGGIACRAARRGGGGGRTSAGRRPSDGRWPAEEPSSGKRLEEIATRSPGWPRGQMPLARRGSDRTATGRGGTHRACCGRDRARTRDTRGSRARGARTGVRRSASRSWPRSVVLGRWASSAFGACIRNARSQSRPTSVFESRQSRITPSRPPAAPPRSRCARPRRSSALSS